MKEFLFKIDPLSFDSWISSLYKLPSSNWFLDNHGKQSLVFRPNLSQTCILWKSIPFLRHSELTTPGPVPSGLHPVRPPDLWTPFTSVLRGKTWKVPNDVPWGRDDPEIRSLRIIHFTHIVMVGRVRQKIFYLYYVDCSVDCVWFPRELLLIDMNNSDS